MMAESGASSHGLAWGSLANQGGPAGGKRARSLDLREQGDGATDQQLVRLARQGSAAAWEALIRRYQDRVYTIACRYLRDPEEALDVTQDTFLRLVEALPRFREQANFGTWVYRIVVNRCIDLRRKRSRCPSSVSLWDSENGWEMEPTETRAALCPHAALEAQELREQLSAAIAAVPESYRMAVILADIEGLSYAEIAQILRCPLNTVRTRLHRGRLAIRERLGPYFKGGEDRD